MATVVVDGNALSRDIRAKIAAAFADHVAKGHPTPCIAILQIGDDPGAAMYTRRLQRTFSDAGVQVEIRQRPADASAEEATRAVAELSADASIHGIQIQTPVPPHVGLPALIGALDPGKDVDGIHPTNAGLLAQGRPAIVPATPAGGMEILARHGVQIEGANAVVVGRSTTVGRPMALLLLQANATVTVCHTRTRSIETIVAGADILAVAAGRPAIITADMIRPGATVIDFGVNVVDGKAVGDVAPDAEARAGVFTPVPGGTGPLTNAMLLRNALELYTRRLGAT